MLEKIPICEYNSFAGVIFHINFNSISPAEKKNEKKDVFVFQTGQIYSSC